MQARRPIPVKLYVVLALSEYLDWRPDRLRNLHCLRDKVRIDRASERPAAGHDVDPDDRIRETRDPFDLRLRPGRILSSRPDLATFLSNDRGAAYRLHRRVRLKSEVVHRTDF